MPPCAPSHPLELRIFGGPSTVVQGREARLALKRAAALLWPDADEPQGRKRLRRLIYTIEDTLGAKLLAADGDGIALLAQAVRIDALEFARFADARWPPRPSASPAWPTPAHGSSARRPLMQEISFGLAAFDNWLQAVSIEHEHPLSRLLERLVDALGRRGDLAAALPLAEVLVAVIWAPNCTASTCPRSSCIGAAIARFASRRANTLPGRSPARCGNRSRAPTISGCAAIEHPCCGPSRSSPGHDRVALGSARIPSRAPGSVSP